ncbi:DUF2490 domain-containing protein [Fulvivirgaceae bacterium PWU4]|uniref:DUF2490 domain-containing protein n=2 Tax=Chryseosolibacter histidini TaxID=2782349 RepID=A0AAP2GPW2_9BACT|nr:DUF2490 domain-containing protein [Chryseosolibacter histidini]
MDYPFANQYLFEMEASYQRLLTNDSTWRSINFTPTLEYQFFNNVDLIFSVPLAYTAQTEDYDSFEARLSFEGRIHLTQNKRVNTRLVLKGEKRYFLNVDEDAWENSTRARVKAEATISINAPDLYRDKLWYAIVDYEEFFVTDQELNERYSNKRRARLGAGYRLDYRNRFELIFTLQSSRNKIHDDFTSTDNVVQLRYKMFFNPSRPASIQDQTQ